jgi:outer membrane lipoprotein LolB
VKRAARAWLALLLLLLAACATPLAPERSYSGRFSAIATQGETRQSISGRFALQVAGTQQVLDLATPLGTTVARIESSPGSATATGPQLQPVSGPNADELLRRVLGWRLPVAGLADWLEGRPDPARPARVAHDGARATILQDGWTITLEDAAPATQRPRRLLLERPARDGDPAVSVRLLVDDPA